MERAAADEHKKAITGRMEAARKPEVRETEDEMLCAEETRRNRTAKTGMVAIEFPLVIQKVAGFFDSILQDRL